MKKMISILLVIAMASALCACSRKEEEHPVTQEELEELLIGETMSEEEVSEPVRFWLNTQRGEKKTFQGTMFGGQAVPVNLENFDENNSPYCWGPNGAFTGQTCEHLSEILQYEDSLISYWEDGAGIIAGDILPRTSYDEKTLQYVRNTDDSNYIQHIYLLNLSREAEDHPSEEEEGVYLYQKHSARDCYEQGWWCIEAEPNGLDLEYDQPAQVYCSDTQMAALWDRLGAPDYVRCENSALLQERLRENEGELAYELVYQYDDFTLSVSVKEAIMNGGNRQKHLLMMDGVRYYAPECWEAVMDEMELTEYAALEKSI